MLRTCEHIPSFANSPSDRYIRANLSFLDAFSKRTWCFLPATFSLPPGNRTVVLKRLFSRLSVEIQDKIVKNGIGRLLFVMRMASLQSASQLPITQYGDLEAVPEHRFTEEILSLNCNTVWIHLVVGGRTYVNHLSDTPGSVQAPLNARRRSQLVSPFRILGHTLSVSAFICLGCLVLKLTQQWSTGYFVPLSVMAVSGFFILISYTRLASCDPDQRMSQDYALNESTYSAIRSDGIGVIDTHSSKLVQNQNGSLIHVRIPSKPEHL